MAGDWIKFGKDTHNKPEVLRLASLMDVSRDAAVGMLLRFWCWLDDAVVDADVDAVVAGVGAFEVDAMMSTPGFARAMELIGWLRFGGPDEFNPCLIVPNFSRHNGETAKKRALKNARQARWRVDAGVDAGVDIRASTREEKRKSNTPIVPEGFIEFWIGYPRKESKQQAIRAWQRLKPDASLRARILADVVSRAQGRWKEDPQFIPYPATYLNNRRWEDERPDSGPRPKRVVA